MSINKRISQIEEDLRCNNTAINVLSDLNKELEKRVAELELREQRRTYDDVKKDAPAVEHKKCCRSEAGRDCSCGADEAKAVEQWKCPHCGKDEGTWFDRTLDADMNMATRCNSCGKNIDDEPKPTTPLADEQTTEVDVASCRLGECKCNGETYRKIQDEYNVWSKINAIVSYVMYKGGNSGKRTDEIMKVIRSHNSLYDPSKISIDRKVAEDWLECMLDGTNQILPADEELIDAIRNALNKQI